MKRPLVWFVAIGLLLFAADHVRTPESIVVDDALKTRLSNLWETQMGAAPSAGELDALVQNWVREEVFYREAMRLGLDSDDTIIRRRLVQKLEFLAEQVRDDEVSAEDLQAFYSANTDKYTLPVRYSVSQILFAERSEAEELKTALADGTSWQSLGQNSLLPASIRKKTRREVSAIFGADFASRLDELIEEQWVGPISSTFGQHLVRLDEHTPEQVTPFNYVENKVLTDLKENQREQDLDDYYAELLDRYVLEYR